jgi:glucan phosphoethanolaminetransferase (alkaline phosphatase superfamily)
MNDTLHTSTQGGTEADDAGRLDRIGALGGIAFTVLAFASTFVVPTAPTVDDAAADIHDYLLDNQTGLGVSIVLYVAALLAFVPFVAMLHHRIAATARSTIAAATFVVAAAAGISLGLLGGLLQAALAQRIAPAADDATVSAWYSVWDIVAFTGPPLAINLAVLVAAVVLYRDRAFPRWVTAVAVLSVVLGVVCVVADLTSEAGAPMGVDLAGFVLSNVWFVAVAVIVLRSRVADAQAPASTARPAAAV